MDLDGLSVAVVGGGIGGFAAAIALASRGASVRLYEQASAFAEVGAGLQISLNGQRVLRALGCVEHSAPSMATVSTGTAFRDGRTGRRVAFVPPPSGGATWYMHRADVLALLVRRAHAVGVVCNLGQAMEPGSLQADLIVAADGVRSLWRGSFDSPVAPRFTGQVAWRALVPWDAQEGTPASLSMARGAHVVSYALRAGQFLNIVAVEERRDWTEDSWSQTGDPTEFRSRFKRFGGALGAAIAQVDNVHTWALHARPVAQDWVHENTVLVGDAAHPTLPFMAQGACLALEDAWILSDALARKADLAAGLAAYQDARQARAMRVVGLAAGNGWRFHMGWPFNWGAYVTLALGAGALARRLEWVYGYDATTALNKET